MAAIIVGSTVYALVVIATHPSTLPASYHALQTYSAAVGPLSITSQTTMTQSEYRPRYVRAASDLQSAVREIQSILPLKDNPTLTTKLNTLVQTTNDWTNAMIVCAVANFDYATPECFQAGAPTTTPMYRAYEDAINAYNDQYQHHKV